MKQSTSKAQPHAGTDSMTSKVSVVAKAEFRYQPQSNTTATGNVEATAGEGAKSSEPRNFFLK